MNYLFNFSPQFKKRVHPSDWLENDWKALLQQAVLFLALNRPQHYTGHAILQQLGYQFCGWCQITFQYSC